MYVITQIAYYAEYTFGRRGIPWRYPDSSFDPNNNMSIVPLLIIGYLHQGFV